MKKIILLFALAAVFTACKKSSSSSTPTSPIDSSSIQYGTPYSGVPDVKDVVMYEVNIRSFSSTNDLPGVTARLDSIKALGVNVIWLMPIYPVGTDAKSINSPYCPKDYKAVNPDLGTMADLQYLVSQAHAKGMAVILDWVADHTSWDNAWIANKSWYQQDANGNIIPPVGSNFTDVAGLSYTGAGNADMRAAMKDAMKFWLFRANIDGFRCDYADAIPNDFWTDAITYLKSFNHKLVLLAEGSRFANYTSGFQMNYGWTYYGQLKSVFGGSAYATTLASTNTSDNNGTPSGSYLIRFITNHDLNLSDGSPITLYKGNSGALAAFVLATYMGGVPMIYNGDEVACPSKLDIFSTHPSTVINWTANADINAAYKQIIAFRNGDDAVKEGGVRYFANNSVSVFERYLASDTVLVMVNVTNAAVPYTLDPALQNTSWTDGMNNNAPVNLTTSVSLSPYQYMILKKK